MARRLRRSYWLLVGPAAALFAGLYVLHRVSGLQGDGLLVTYPWVGLVVAVAGPMFGVAAPIALRTAFVYRYRRERSVTMAGLERFQRRQMRTALAAPYLAVAAAFFELPRVPFLATALSAFYALYYLYPSRRRIEHDARIFRVR